MVLSRRSMRCMLSSHTIALLLTVCACLLSWANASSERPLPLKRMAHISDVRIRRVDVGRHTRSDQAFSSPLEKRSAAEIAHSDSFRLSFRAFDNHFHLHLQPTENIVPEDGATVRYTAFDPVIGADVVQRTEKIFAKDVRAFNGVVMHSDYTHERFAEDAVGFRRDASEWTSGTDEGIMGRASILLHDDGSSSGSVRFEGLFDWAGNEHVLQTPRSYHTSRSSHDPVLGKRALEDGATVIHRRSDRMTNDEAVRLGIRSSSDDTDLGCNADQYEYNSQNALRIPASGDNKQFTTMSALSFFALPPKLGRRHLSALSDLFQGSSAPAALHRRSNVFETAAALQQTASYSYHEAFVKRQGDLLGGTNNNSYINDIGSTQGCPSANRAVYMGIATDCTYTGRFSNSSETRLSVLNDMNTVSNIYRSTFRVALGVVELEIREATDCPTSAQGDAQWNRQCSDSYALDQRLSDFSAWRANQPANGTGLWHLLTTCLSGSEVGVAWLGTLCKTDRSGSGSSVVSGTGVTASTQNEAQTMAHEIGHNFGAVHDCIQGCSLGSSTARQSSSTGGGAICCPQSASGCNTNGRYIMSPVSSQSTQTFSPCSIGNICSMLGQGLDTSCVEDPAETQRATLSAQQCGNGILEPGEECDAGPNGSQCCTTSCRLTSGSVCDPEGSACCTDQCQFAGTSTVCRPAVDERCDTAETCSGTSADCPEDVRKDNGASCGSGLQCAAGHCTSRDLQCQQQSSADYNFTQACPLNADNSCSVSCRDPRQINACAVLQQNFIDGTECGYGGFCEGGDCKSGSWQATFRGWYVNNLRISIPVTIVVGIIVLLVLYGLLRCLCLPLIARGTGKKVRGAKGPMMSSVTNMQPDNSRAYRQSRFADGDAGIPPPPPQHPNGYHGGAQHRADGRANSGQRWADPYSYNGPIGSSYPSH